MLIFEGAQIKGDTEIVQKQLDSDTALLSKKRESLLKLSTSCSVMQIRVDQAKTDDDEKYDTFELLRNEREERERNAILMANLTKTYEKKIAQKEKLTETYDKLIATKNSIENKRMESPKTYILDDRLAAPRAAGAASASAPPILISDATDAMSEFDCEVHRPEYMRNRTDFLDVQLIGEGENEQDDGSVRISSAAKLNFFSNDLFLFVDLRY